MKNPMINIILNVAGLIVLGLYCCLAELAGRQKNKAGKACKP